MARQSMGQMYVGSGLGAKWNRGWEAVWQSMASSLFEVNIADIPQEAFDNLLSLAFWAVADQNFDGKVPSRVEDCVIVPDRCDKDLGDVLVACKNVD